MPYIFFHIPKTAGTTLRGMLNLAFGSQLGRVYAADQPEPGKTCYIGHRIRYGFHMGLEGRSHYIVFLRSPITRNISLYEHDYVAALKEKQQPPPLVKWLENLRHAPTMTSYLGRSREQAEDTLHSMSFIGLQETFKEDTAQLLPGVPMHFSNVAANKAKRWGGELPILSEEEIQALDDFFLDDKRLYAYAVNLRNHGFNTGFSLPVNHNAGAN